MTVDSALCECCSSQYRATRWPLKQRSLWQVRAERVLATQGPQPYALVVLGRFNGTLLSSFNPAAAAAGAASEPCRIVVAVITDGPSGLTNHTCAPRTNM